VVDDTPMIDMSKPKTVLKDPHPRSRSWVVESIFAVLVLLSSYSVYFKHSQFASLVFELLLIMLGIFWLFTLRGRIDKIYVYYYLFFLFSMSAVLFVSMVNSSDLKIAFIAQKIVMLCVVIPLFGLIFSVLRYEYVIDRVLSRLISLTVFLCSIGILIWLSVVLVNIPIPSLTISFNWGSSKDSTGYLGLFFFTQSALVGSRMLPRFTLFFVEAPLANFVFLTLLSVELLLKQHSNLYSVLVLSLSSLLTFSTFGIILLPIIFLFWLISSPGVIRIKEGNIVVKFFRMLTIVCSCTILPIWVFYSIQNKSNLQSLDAHFRDIQTGTLSFSDSPIWGHGIGDYQSAYVEFGAGFGQTSGLFSVLSQGGILLLSCYVIPLIGFLFSGKILQERSVRLFAVVLVLSFCFVIVDNNILFGICMALGLSMSNEAIQRSEQSSRTEMLKNNF
jgi:hypothetical protein